MSNRLGLIKHGTKNPFISRIVLSRYGRVVRDCICEPKTIQLLQWRILDLNFSCLVFKRVNFSGFMVGFENFVESMSSCLLKLKVPLSFSSQTQSTMTRPNLLLSMKLKISWIIVSKLIWFSIQLFAAADSKEKWLLMCWVKPHI